MRNTLHETDDLKLRKKAWAVFAAYLVMVIVMTCGAESVFAAGDPIGAVNNLSTFIFSLIRAIGLILLGLGVMQVGLSMKSHDPSQRANVRP